MFDFMNSNLMQIYFINQVSAFVFERKKEEGEGEGTKKALSWTRLF